MRFALLDEVRCSCGSQEMRIEGAVTTRREPPPEGNPPCRRFCGLRQRPVRPGETRSPECLECSRLSIVKGLIRCTCGQTWPVIDGVPCFSGGPVTAPSQGFCVRESNPRTDPRWEPFVRAHPLATPYHHPGWLRALEEEYGQRRLHLVCEGPEGRLAGVLPLFYTRGLPFNIAGNATRRRLSSLPRTPVGGVLSLNPEATAALLQAAVECSRREPDVQLQIKSWDSRLHELASELVPTSWRPTYATPLPDSPDKILFGNSASRHRLKWGVNKAIRLGLDIREASSESDLRAWYPLYLEVMRQNAVPPRPYRLFRALWELLRPAGVLRLLLAERTVAGERILIAGSIILTLGATACYAFTGGRKRDFVCHPNDLIQWEAIHAACRMGARRYDFGEVAEEHQLLVNFKSKWGAEPMPQYRYYVPPPEVRTMSGHGSAGWFRRLTAAGWRHLPLSTTGQIGDRVYHYL